MNEYMDFEIEIKPMRDGAYPVENNNSATGDGDSVMTLPFSLTQLDEILPKLGVLAPKPTTIDGDETTDITNWGSRKVGNALFKSLFTGEILENYRGCLAKAGKQPVRIKLRFDPDSEELQALSRYPWEVMYDHGTTPLALDTRYSIVRYLEINKPIPDLPMPQLLKILIVMPQPKGFGAFDAEEAERQIRDSFEGTRNVELHVLENPTFSTLTQYMEDEPIHILHFTGHGGKYGDDWSLAFEKENGEVNYVSGEALAAALNSSLDHLRLVTVVSCEGGRSAENVEDNPFNGVANALVRDGVPAVVGMQYPISIEGAFHFTKAFYSKLAKGEAVDRAVDVGRRMMYSNNHGAMEWGAPVLYMRTPNGVIFSEPEEQKVLINVGLDDSPVEAKFREMKNLKEVNLSYFFENRRAIYPGVWNDKVYPALKNLKKEIKPDYPMVFVGKAWLSIWMGLGQVFSATTGFEPRIIQHNTYTQEDEIWSTAVNPTPVLIEVEWERQREGSELAVSISLNNNIEANVERYMEAEKLPWRRWLKLRPKDAPERKLIENNEEALGLAQAMSDKIRETVKKHNIFRTHLFVAAPSGFAFFLGHLLTACGEIQIYEYQQPTGEGEPIYAPSIAIGRGGTN